MTIREGIKDVLINSDRCITDDNCNKFNCDCKKCIDHDLDEYEYEVYKKQ